MRDSYAETVNSQRITNQASNNVYIKNRVFMLSMSSCEPCKKAKKYLSDNNISFDYIDVDIADEDDWDRALDIIGDYIPAQGMKMIFPMIVINGVKVIQGFSIKQMQDLLHI